MTPDGPRASPNLLAAFALLTIMAIAALIYYRGRSVPASPGTVDPEIALGPQRELTDRLSHEVEELKGEVQRLSAAAVAKGPDVERRPAATRTDVDQRLREFEERIMKLEATVVELQREAVARRTLQGTGDAPSASPPKPSPEEIQQRITNNRRVVVDGNLPEAERLNALRELRGLGQGARGGQVAVSMVELAQTSRDPKVRADVWRQMHGARDPALLEPLIAALQSDKDEKVRDEAAETLDDFVDLPHVRQVLEHAAKNDPSAMVQRQAAQSLSRRR